MNSIDKHPGCSCNLCRHSNTSSKKFVKKESKRRIRYLAKKYARDETDGPIIVSGGYRS
jgi:hypothetical protein